MDKKVKKLVFTVTNDLVQDQRMHRICTTLINEDYDVLLVGRKKSGSGEVLTLPFRQRRLFCFFQKGFLFYAEYNIRLFFFLMGLKFDLVCSIDTDTLAPCRMVSWLNGKKMTYDAHEYFTEVPELEGRMFVKLFWKWVEFLFLRGCNACYTVNKSLASIFTEKYGIPFTAIYNVPEMVSEYNSNENLTSDHKILFYQGVLNKGRGLEDIILAMEFLPDFKLQIAGEGDLSEALRNLAMHSGASERIKFLGWLTPTELKTKTTEVWLGLNLLDKKSLSYYYSLANKFFDYMHAGVPSLNMNFPEYVQIIEEYPIGICVEDHKPETLVKVIKELGNNMALYDSLKVNCRVASKKYNWENEAVKLSELYRKVLH
ncbi:MAG: glycosyltransferase [Saprospiraceae bacterium]|nr:glycosyltransferase [Saprospiraceae bacterium]